MMDQMGSVKHHLFCLEKGMNMTVSSNFLTPVPRYFAESDALFFRKDLVFRHIHTCESCSRQKSTSSYNSVTNSDNLRARGQSWPQG